jgi:PAS domain S-box-containing protein
VRPLLDRQRLNAASFSSYVRDVHEDRFGLGAREASAREGACTEETCRLDVESDRLFEETPIPVWIYDVETLAFLDANDAAVRDYGYSRAEFRQMTLEDIRPASAVPSLHAHLLVTRERFNAITTFTRHRSRDGRTFDVEVTGFPVRFAGRRARIVFINDVTQRKKAEAQARYQTLLLATMADAVIATDEQFVITSWNHAAQLIYGWKEEEALGRPMAEVLRAQVSEAEREEALDGLVKTGQLNCDWRRLTKDGRPVEIEGKTLALRDSDGKRIGYVSVHRDVRERRRQEDMIRMLFGHVVSAQEDERRRIARELHDDTAQSLASLLVGLRSLEDAESVAESRAAARDLRALTARALDEVQRIARGLRPSVLDDLGLGEALERMAADASRNGIAVTIRAICSKPRLPDAVETTLYRIAQEALSNTQKHAAARSLSILLTETPSRVQLIVEDDGRGFNVERRPPAGHFGLVGMQERAALLGGSVSFESSIGCGTRVYVTIPLFEHA